MTILNIKKDANRISFPHLEKAIKANCVSNQKSPDIFYLIFDTYGGIHSLKKYMKYDNQPFYDYLNQHGFITPAYSNCYYPDTRLSLVSLLNLNFLDPKIPLENAFKENMVMETLHRFGYINHFFSTGSYFFVDFDGLDYFHEISFLNPFRFKLFEMTPLLAIESRVLVYDYQSKTTLTLKKISEMKPEKKSKFIFAHILCPHPPFVFGQNGEIADKTKFRIKLGKKLFLKQIYTDQITYLNELIKGTVDNLKSNYNNNVVIILQADNGFFFNSFYELTSNSSLSKEDYKMACTEIFNAIYLPDGNLENLKDTISSINTMRLIFNKYFCTKLALLPNKTDYRHLEVD